jgi:hypothetical protein
MRQTFSRLKLPKSALFRWGGLPWAVATVLILAAFPLVPPENYSLDLHVFHQAARATLEGRTVYDPSTHFQFRYAPIIATLFSGLWGRMEFTSAIALHYFLFLPLWLGFVVWQTGMVLRHFEIKPTSVNLGWGFLIFLGFFGSVLAEELALGQVNLLPLVSLFAYLKTAHHKNKWIPAFFLSFACQFKLMFGFFAFLPLMTRQWRVLVFAAAWALILNLGMFGLLHGFAFAWSESIAWLRNISDTTPGLMIFRWNASFLSALAKRTGDGSALALLPWVLLVIVWISTLWKIRADLYRSFLWALLAVVVLTPVVWSNWALFLFPVLLTVGLEVPWRRLSIDHRVGLVLGALFCFITFNAHHSYFTRDGALSVAGILLGFFLIPSKYLKLM